MAEMAKKTATYDDLHDVPDNMIGEIIDGELIVTPRPSRRHGYTTFALGNEIGPPYQFGRAEDLEGGYLSLNRKLDWKSISWSRTWLDGKKRDIRRKNPITGFRLPRIGYVKSFRRIP